MAKKEEEEKKQEKKEHKDAKEHNKDDKKKNDVQKTIDYEEDSKDKQIENDEKDSKDIQKENNEKDAADKKEIDANEYKKDISEKEANTKRNESIQKKNTSNRKSMFVHPDQSNIQKDDRINDQKSILSRRSKIQNEGGNGSQDNEPATPIVQQSNEDEVASKATKAANDVIQDILANELHEENIASKENLKFAKKTLIHRVEFSFGNLDEWFHMKYRHVNSFIRCAIECFFVAFLLLFFVLIAFITAKDLDLKDIYTFNKHLDPNQQKNPYLEFYRSNLFMAIIYTVYIMVALLIDNILYVSAYILNIFNVKIQGKTAEMLQILQASRHHLKNTISSFLTFLLAITILQAYKFKEEVKNIRYILITLFFWFGCLSGLLFVEKFVMNFITSEIRRKSFRGRIWDANFKTFIFKKLAAISEANDFSQDQVDDIIANMKTDYDTGFFLRHNDLNLSTQEQAAYIAEGIFAYLDITELTYESILEYFPDSFDEVYAYISGNKIDEEAKEHPPVPFEIVKTRCVDLYKERTDISRSLYDRDNILRKLDLILVGLVLFFSLIIFFILMNVDYKVYIASIGPLFFGFGWIFQDSIKDLYKCFVFHLASHPFDCGDRVRIGLEELIVLRIELLYTTFITLTGKIKYIPNPAMFMEKIENIRRSDLQSEKISVFVTGATTFERMLAVRERLTDFLSKNSKDFTGKICISEYVPEEEKLKVTFIVEHCSNFQEHIPHLARSEKFTKEFEKILNSEGCSFEKGFIITD